MNREIEEEEAIREAEEAAIKEAEQAVREFGSLFNTSNALNGLMDLSGDGEKDDKSYIEEKSPEKQENEILSNEGSPIGQKNGRVNRAFSVDEDLPAVVVRVRNLSFDWLLHINKYTLKVEE